MSPINRGRRAGFTMLESVIALVIFSTILSAGVIAMRAGQRSFRQTVTGTVLNTKASRAVNRIARRLTGARQLSVAISADTGTVSFQEVAGWAGGDPIWSGDSSIAFQYETGELDNGVDDNGNGFVDEGQVILTENIGDPDQRSVTLVHSVREFLDGETPDGTDENGNGIADERGLCFELVGDALRVRLTVQRRDSEGAVILRTLETTVGMRN